MSGANWVNLEDSCHKRQFVLINMSLLQRMKQNWRNPHHPLIFSYLEAAISAFCLAMAAAL